MAKAEECHADMPGSNLPRHSGIFFLKKSQFQET